jgi:ubiquinone/menaquinone biosynthesis C-methylase UbiE
MINDKPNGMNIASLYDYDYWDGERKYGYGGYKYIPGYWKQTAELLIKTYNLNETSSILDIGCGKGFLLYELKLLIPSLTIKGIDISTYAVEKAIPEVMHHIQLHSICNKLPFQNDEFDLVFSINVLHNLKVFELKSALMEIQRVGRQAYICVESYRNLEELFNLQCWALTCQSFYSKDEWIWIFNEFDFHGDYEFIYFV